MTSERPDDAEVRAVEQRLAATFPLDCVEPPPFDAVFRGAVARRDAARLRRSIVALSTLVAVLGVAATALAVTPLRPAVTPRPQTVASATATPTVDASTSVSYSPPLVRVPPGARVLSPYRRVTLDAAVASRAVGFTVLLPTDTLGSKLKLIDIPYEDATSTPQYFVAAHYGAFDLGEYWNGAPKEAADEVRHEPEIFGFDGRWDHWVDVNGRRAYAHESSNLVAPGGRVVPFSGVMWNDGAIVYRLSSRTLTYDQLLAIARSVPAR